MKRSSLSRLQASYGSLCDGDWEHSAEVGIDTLDNPSEPVHINVACSCLDEVPFEAYSYGVGSETDRSGAESMLSLGRARLRDTR